MSEKEANLSQNPPHEEHEMKKKQESKYQSFDDTEKICILLVGHKMGKGILKYANDPVGMHRDEDFKIFVDPFLQYLKGDISFEKAQDELNGVRTDALQVWIERWHSFFVETFYETKTGRNFWTDYKTLKEGEEKDKKEATLNLVSAFKPALKENADIKVLFEKAVIEGDESFSSALFETSISECPDKKLWLNYLIFARLNEDTILKMSQDEIVDLARSQDVLSKIPPKNYFEAEKEKKRLLTYLQRLGIKKDKVGRPHKFDKPELSEDDRLLRLELENHKIEFSFYLFDPDSKEEIEKRVKSIEKLILNFK
jgi:hypothetical protein